MGMLTDQWKSSFDEDGWHDELGITCTESNTAYRDEPALSVAQTRHIYKMFYSLHGRDPEPLNKEDYESLVQLHKLTELMGTVWS